MKTTVGIKIATGFGLALIVFMLVGAASYDATARLIEASNWRKQSFLVLDQLNDVRPLLVEVELNVRTYYLTGETSFLDRSRAAADRMGPILDELRRMTADQARHREYLNALAPLIRRRLDATWDTVAVYQRDGAKAAAQRVLSGDGPQLGAQIVTLLQDMEKYEQGLLDQRTQAAESGARTTKTTIVAGTFMGLALALLAGFLITRDISRPLAHLTSAAEQITIGDVSVHVPASERGDEVGVLARGLDRMTHYLRGMAAAAQQLAAGNLRSTVTPQSSEDVLGHAFAQMSAGLNEQIRGMVEAVDVLAVSANQIVAATAQLASSASESAAAVAQTTATVEEVRQTAELTTHKAGHVSDAAQRVVTEAQTGRKSTQELTAGMDRIRRQMDAIVASMGRLSEYSHAIGQIIASVEDLATQSNLLAVNAAIEAAKAGEHGKGFGVVAQEVKALAAQSRQATGQVRTILADIQGAMGSAMAAIELGGRTVDEGGRATHSASESIEVLSASINEAAQAATQIAAASRQQLIGVDQVAGAMESIRQASGQNMDSARNLEKSARDLKVLGEQFQQIVARYSV